MGFGTLRLGAGDASDRVPLVAGGGLEFAISISGVESGFSEALAKRASVARKAAEPFGFWSGLNWGTRNRPGSSGIATACMARTARLRTMPAARLSSAIPVFFFTMATICENVNGPVDQARTPTARMLAATMQDLGTVTKHSESKLRAQSPRTQGALDRTTANFLWVVCRGGVGVEPTYTGWRTAVNRLIPGQSSFSEPLPGADRCLRQPPIDCDTPRAPWPASPLEELSDRAS